jgi:hypothetical protein
VGFADIDLERGEVVRVADRPALAPGPLGHFDDHGVYAMSIVEDGGRLLLYYVGWNPGKPPLYYPSVGLAASDDGGETFERVSRAPIMARHEVDPWMVSSPYVLREGDRWRMWYLSGLGWQEEDDGLHSYYHIKYAESDDGREWRRDGRVALDLKPGERNIARTCILREGGRYRAWYPYNRGDGYRIGYAESADGLDWERRDEEAGIEPGPEPYDSEALAYPWVVVHAGTRYLLYNGNGFGREGIALAEQPA